MDEYAFEVWTRSWRKDFAISAYRGKLTGWFRPVVNWEEFGNGGEREREVQV